MMWRDAIKTLAEIRGTFTTYGQFAQKLGRWGIMEHKEDAALVQAIRKELAKLHSSESESP